MWIDDVSLEPVGCPGHVWSLSHWVQCATEPSARIVIRYDDDQRAGSVHGAVEDQRGIGRAVDERLARRRIVGHGDLGDSHLKRFGQRAVVRRGVEADRLDHAQNGDVAVDPQLGS